MESFKEWKRPTEEYLCLKLNISALRLSFLTSQNSRNPQNKASYSFPNLWLNGLYSRCKLYTPSYQDIVTGYKKIITAIRPFGTTWIIDFGNDMCLCGSLGFEPSGYDGFLLQLQLRLFAPGRKDSILTVWKYHKGPQHLCRIGHEPSLSFVIQRKIAFNCPGILYSPRISTIFLYGSQPRNIRVLDTTVLRFSTAHIH